MMQKFFDGEYASIFMYVGAIQSFVNSGKYGPDKQHIAPMPTFEIRQLIFLHGDMF